MAAESGGGAGDLWARFARAAGGAAKDEEATAEPQAEPIPAADPSSPLRAGLPPIPDDDDEEDDDLGGASDLTAANVEDEVSSLFADLESSGSQFGLDTQKIVYKTRPQARDVDRVVGALVRTLVSKREITEKDLDVILEITKSRIMSAIRAQVL